MKKVQKIWAELSKAKKAPQRTKLSAKKRGVKLNAIQEVENAREYGFDSYNEAVYIVETVMPDLEEKCYDIQRDVDNIIVNSEASSLETFADELSDAIATIQKSADELGVDAEEIYDGMQEAQRLLATMRALQGDWDDLEKNYPLVYRLTNLK